MDILMKSRVVIMNEEGETKTKSAHQIVQENDRLAKRLKQNTNTKAALTRTDQMKDAIRKNDFSHLSNTSPPPKEKPKMADTATVKRHVSLNFGIVGSGAAGGRIVEQFTQYGYKGCVINTASQDLEYLNLPEEKKYLIDNKALGGTGKDLDISAQCFEERETEIREFIDQHTEGCDALILAISGGGGTGSGSAELLANWMYDTGKPILVIYILPGSFDDPQAKHNAITTLDTLSEMAVKELISSLILVDNAKIESTYRNLSQAAFFQTANKAVVEPLHMFNSVSVSPTNYEALDSMDFAKALIEAGNCVVFGTNIVPKDWYEDDETALMEAIIDGLQRGLLASGFDLKEAQTVGILVTAQQSVLEQVPFSSIAYMFKYVSDEFASAKSFKGVYGVPTDNDDITIRFIFSGMGLPKERVGSLKDEAKKHMETLADKKAKTNMKVGLGKDRATSQIDRNIAKIKKSKGSIGKLMGAGKKPKRRR
jgi:cell division GTPase FtsZ